MKTATRTITNIEQFFAEVRPRVRDSVIAVASRRSRRPVQTRCKQPDEIRILIEAAATRRRMLAERGILVQTGPRSWTLNTGNLP